MKSIQFLKDKSSIIGKKVRFTANCDFFPNFDTTVTINSVSQRSNGEFLYSCKVIKNSKTVTIGTNMKGLKYEII